MWLAALAVVHQFDMHGLPIQQGGFHMGQSLPVRFGALQQPGAFADDLVAAVAGYFFKCRVDIDDARPRCVERAGLRDHHNVIEALNAGRVSISATPQSPRLVLTAASESNGIFDLGMGDNLVLKEDRPVQLKIELENTEVQTKFYRLEVIRDGSVLTTLNVFPGQTSVTFTDQPGANTRTYYRVTMQGLSTPLVDSPGSFIPSLPMVAISNPVYINYQN